MIKLTVEAFKAAFEEYAESRGMPEGMRRGILEMIIGKYREAIERLDDPQEVFSEIDRIFKKLGKRFEKRLKERPIHPSQSPEEYANQVVEEVLTEWLPELIEASETIRLFKEILGEDDRRPEEGGEREDN